MTEQPVTFVNVLDVEPERQHELVELLAKGGREAFGDRAGFVSMTIPASRDGRRVINLAQWSSGADALAAQGDDQATEYAVRVGAIATAAAPGIFAVAAEIR